MTRVKPVKTKHQVWIISHFTTRSTTTGRWTIITMRVNYPRQESFTIRAEICGHGAGEFEIWAWEFGPEDGKCRVDNDGQVATEIAGHGVRTLYLIEELCGQ